RCARHDRDRGTQDRVSVLPHGARAAQPAADRSRRSPRPPRRGDTRSARATTPRRSLASNNVLGPRQTGSRASGLVKSWTSCYLRPQLQGETSPWRPRETPMAARAATAYSPQKAQRELEDLQLVLKARNGDSVAMDALIRRYTGFVRLKASAYFLAGGDGEDLVQEGLVGLYKAVRDFRADKETSFRS